MIDYLETRIFASHLTSDDLDWVERKREAYAQNPLLAHSDLIDWLLRKEDEYTQTFMDWEYSDGILWELRAIRQTLMWLLENYNHHLEAKVMAIREAYDDYQADIEAQRYGGL